MNADNVNNSKQANKLTEQYLIEKISHQQKIIDNLREQIVKLQIKQTITSGDVVDRDDYFDENQIGFIESVSKQELIRMIMEKSKQNLLENVTEKGLELFRVNVLKQLYFSEPKVISKFIKNVNNNDFPFNNMEQQKRKIKAYARKEILKRIFEELPIEYSLRRKFGLLTFTAVKFFEDFPMDIKLKLLDHLRRNKEKIWNKEYVKGYYFIISTLKKQSIEECFGFLKNKETVLNESYQDIINYIIELVGKFVFFINGTDYRYTDGLKEIVSKFEVSDSSMLKGVYGELVFAYMASTVYGWKILSFQKEFKGILHKGSFVIQGEITPQESDIIFNILCLNDVVNVSTGEILYEGSFVNWKLPKELREMFAPKVLRKIRGIMKMIKKSSQGEIDLLCLDQEGNLWDVEVKNWTAGSVIRCDKFLKEISRQLNSKERDIYLNEFKRQYTIKTDINIKSIKKMAVLDCDTPFSEYLADTKEYDDIIVRLFDLTPRKLSEDIFLKT